MTDIFISHASEDKAAVARPVAAALQDLGWTVWLDEFELLVGDSLRREIEAGLSHCRFGVVILSRAFFGKEWPQWELDGLLTRELSGRRGLILPIWHNVDVAYVAERSPPLAGKLAVSTNRGID